jgi:hypothetical protein
MAKKAREQSKIGGNKRIAAKFSGNQEETTPKKQADHISSLGFPTNGVRKK